MGQFQGLVLVLVQGSLAAVGCLLLLRHYQSPIVTVDVSVSVYISWILGFAGVLFLPYDLSLAVDGTTIDRSSVTIWDCIYWSTFILAWIILPIQMEFHSSGHFTAKEKFIDSLRRNIYNLLVAVALGVVFIIFMIISGIDGSVTDVVAFLMAMSNTYGVIIITVLLGSGLVAFPRLLWETGFPLSELSKLYLTADIVETAFQDARFYLEDCELEVIKVAGRLGGNKNSELSRYVYQLQEEVANFEFKGRIFSRRLSITRSEDSVSDDKPGLVALHARLKWAQMKVRHADKRWRNHVSKAYYLEQLAKRIETQSWSPICSCEQWPTNTTIYNKAVYVKDVIMQNARAFRGALGRFMFRALAVVCAVASAVILWSECAMPSDLNSPIGLWLVSLSQDSSNFIAMQLISVLTLVYMSICTYWSLFRINLGAMYTLQGPQLSLPASLIFNAQYFSRLQFSLGYNFLIMLNIQGTDRTAFNTLMSNMNTIPVFGHQVTVYVPIIMVLVAGITMMNLYGRMLRVVGVETEDSATTTSVCCGGSSIEDASQLEFGKRLIASAIRQLGLQDEEKATVNPIRQNIILNNILSNESNKPFKYHRAAGSEVEKEETVPETPYEEEESVDFSVLFAKKSSANGKDSNQSQGESSVMDPLRNSLSNGVARLSTMFRSSGSKLWDR